MRSLQSIIAYSLAFSFAFGANVAAAAGKKDKDVEKIISQAIDEDYLATEYDKALGKLKKALDTCSKADACSPEMLAKVHVAQATVQGVGQGKLDAAKKSLIEALKADPEAKLLDGLSTPELEKAYKEAKAEAGSTGEGGGDGGKGGGDGGKGEGGKGEGGKGGGEQAPAADFQHTPFEAAPLNTPVPIFAEVPDEVGATKVIARYKPFGGGKWETLVLNKMDGGWGAEVPCAAVTTTGDLKYFIVASDESGTPVATAGSMKQPFKVAIKNKVTGDKPALPGKDPPKACKAVEDCPPGLAGCGGSAEGKPEGAICDATPECGKGLACTNGVCTPDGSSTGDETPDSGTHHVISVGAQFDISYVGDGADVCNSGSAASYICMVSDSDPSKQFVGNPLDVKGTNGISGGLAFGGARLFAGYDYFFKFGLGLGARVGYAFGGPSIDETQKIPEGSKYKSLGKSFFPAHIEARASWKFLHPNPEAGDIAPHVFVGGGGAQVNAAVPVTVCDKLKDDGSGGDCPGQTKVDAYQLSGLTFITFGGGATYMFVKNFGLSAEAKFMVLFPTVGFSISPTISPVVAF